MPKTRKFKWVDRETTSRNLLQLAYYAPDNISRRALYLLNIFSNQSIVPDLVAITLDTDRPYRERDHGLFALRRVEGVLDLPELAAIILEDFAFHQHASSVAIASDDWHYDCSGFLSRSLYEFILSHPENVTWFCETLETINDPRYARDLLTSSSAMNPETNRRLAEWLIPFIKRNGDKFSTESIANVLAWKESILAQKAQPADLNNLDDLRDWLRSEPPRNYERSPVWQELNDLFKSAIDGDYTAFQRIRSTATGWNSYLPLQGVAVYFLGQLQNHFDVLKDLCWLVKHPRDNWYFDNSGYPWHPVRAEAINALYLDGSALAWEALLGGFFINPSDSIDYRFINTIESITQCLTFGPGQAAEEREQRFEIARISKPDGPWFDVLREMDQDLEFYLRNWGTSRIG